MNDRFTKQLNNVLIANTATLDGNIEIGEGSLISDYVTITGNVKIGKYCHIGHYSHLSGKHGIEIGNFSALSGRCSIYTESDDYSGDALYFPTEDKYRKPEIGKVRIGEQCLFGYNSLIMPSVYVSDGAIFGARSFLKGRYFGEALFVSDGNKPAQFVKELQNNYYYQKAKREEILNAR